MKNNYTKGLKLPMVYYFYMPALEDKSAEVIEVLHGDDYLIHVPMRDEDKQLKAFYQRPITTREIANFGEWQTWQIFASWHELEEDHAKWNVPEEVLQELRKFRHHLALSEPLAA